MGIRAAEHCHAISQGRRLPRELSALLLFSGLLALSGCSRVSVVEEVVPGHGFHGIHGLTFEPGDNDHVYVGSVIGQSIYKVNVHTGEWETHVGPPEGMADDLEFGPDGSLVWTSFLLGKVHAKKGDGPTRVLAEGLPGINSLAFKQDGRLFATQVFLGDALYEIDPAGEQPARQIMEGMGGLNGFDFGPDGLLYGPLWFRGQVVKVDVDKAELTTVADGFEVPNAVNFDSQGNLYALDTAKGHTYRVNTETGEKTLISDFAYTSDNLAFDGEDRLYQTIIPENAIYEVDTETGEAREVIADPLSIPADITIDRRGGRHDIYIAGLFALRHVDGETGEVRDIARFEKDEIDYPTGITVGDERIIVSSFNSGVVQVLDRETGELLHQVDELSGAYDVLELEDGSILVAQLMAGLTRLSGEGYGTKEKLPVRLAGATCLADAGEGAVYVTETFGGRVSRVDLETGERTDVALNLKLPEGIDVAPDGRVIVAEAGRARVIAIDPATGDVETLQENLPIGLQAPPGMPASWITTGLAVADDGTIYFSSDKEDALYRIAERWRFEYPG